MHESLGLVRALVKSNIKAEGASPAPLLGGPGATVHSEVT
jgi:hypothetical protein